MTVPLPEVRLDAVPPDVIVRLMLTLDRAADDFLGDLRRRGYSERTLTTYRRTYDELQDRLPVDFDVSKITTDDLRGYLRTKQHLKPGTVATHEAHLSSLFRWLMLERKTAKDPVAGLPRTKRQHPTDLDVLTVSTDDVKRMLFAAKGWPQRLCIGVLVYTGCRRKAAANLKIADYDRARGRLRFREKGGKTIWKPVPDELDSLLEAAIAAGVYEHQDYLIPNEGPRAADRRGERDDRVIWRIVKDVARKAGVEAHTHSLRAAFAVFYLQTHEGDSLGLQKLMGHRSPATTQIYLRKLDDETQMERVRDLSWGVAISDNMEPAVSPQIAEKMLESSAVMGAGGFEPPFAESRLEHKGGGQQ